MKRIIINILKLSLEFLEARWCRDSESENAGFFETF